MRYGWSLEEPSWQRLRALKDRGKWRRCKLDQLQRVHVPTEPGIYLIGASATKDDGEPFSTLYNAIYVGQSTNLQARFLQHIRTPQDPLRLARSCFPILDYWFLEVDASELDSLEAVLIDCLGPSANRRSGIRARIGPRQAV
jgi:hypothetical protein